MLTEEMKRNKRNSYYEMKVAFDSSGKSKVVEKLGASIVASINKIKKLKTEIMSSS